MTDTRQMIIAEIPRLRRFARGLVGDPTHADDLVQDCLERALARLGQWRQGTSIRAWLCTILRNIHLNQIRYAAKRPNETSFDEEHDVAIGIAPTQGQNLAIRDIEQALLLLSIEQREVILLVGLEDMSYKEASGILGVPVGTVMSRLSRGREALRGLMKNNDCNDNPTLRRVK